MKSMRHLNKKGCNICSKTYKSRKSLLRHQETCLKKYKNTRIQEWDDDVDKDLGDDVDQFDLNKDKLLTETDVL